MTVRRLKIAIVTHAISPFAHIYAEVFAAAGHSPELVSISGGDIPSAGFPLHQVGRQEFKPWKGDSRLEYARLLPSLRRTLRRLEPDVVHALYLSSAGMAAALCAPGMLVVSALGTDVHSRRSSTPWRLAYRWLGRRAQVVHAVSDELASTLIDEFRVPRERVVVAPIGIDTRKIGFTPEASRPRKGAILTTRAHDPVYDQGTLVRAAECLDERGVDFHMTFASGRQVDATKALVEHSKIKSRVAFLGGFANDRLPALLADADVYVSCSKSDGTSQSLLEAMSSGLFPVVSDIPANRPWIKHGENGCLFPVGDAEKLAECLEHALSRPELRQRAAVANREAVMARGDQFANGRRLLDRIEAAHLSLMPGHGH